MVKHILWTVLDLLIQGYCATGDCARLHDERYYCTTEKVKNTTNCAYNRSCLLKIKTN